MKLTNIRLNHVNSGLESKITSLKLDLECNKALSRKYHELKSENHKMVCCLGSVDIHTHDSAKCYLTAGEIT